MKTRLVRIGNSRGVRLPKTIIAQAGLTEEVELEVRDAFDRRDFNLSLRVGSGQPNASAR
jgi:hypothetical protein